MLTTIKKTIVLTFDVEDWFQVENLRSKYPPEVWDKCEVRVLEPMNKLLELLDKYDIKATFFVLGWIAERFPNIVSEVHERGHEIASHGYCHIMNNELAGEQIMEDLRKSKELLENITGVQILGYRAPSFSINETVIQFLKKEGFVYDSSYHPFSRNKRYGNLGIQDFKDFFLFPNGLIEFPLPVLKTKHFEFPIAGGGYFRLYPFALYKLLFENYMKDHQLFVAYFHPWEFDPNQPVVRGIKLSYKFRHYVGIKNAFSKLEKFIVYLKKEYLFSTLRGLIDTVGGQL